MYTGRVGEIMRGASSSSGSGGSGGSGSGSGGRQATAPNADGRRESSGSLQSLPTASIGKPDSPAKLVFGLSPKTNKLKHDEYAERRGASSSYFATRAATLSQDSNTMNENGSPVDESKLVKAASKSREQTKYGKQEENISGQNKSKDKPSLAIKSSIDSASTSTSTSSPAPTVVRKNRASSPADKGSKQRQESPKKTGEAAAAAAAVAADGKKRTVAPSLVSKTTNGQLENSLAFKNKQQIHREEEQLDIKPKKMQFNIPPPPQVNSSSSRKGSVVSYAKSRIYDKPAKQHLSSSSSSSSSNSIQLNGQKSNLPVGLMLTDSQTVIPESILSGFKPPKQVNVSKAREKWEGGEPFAKCKSRQRLAAQRAGKKLQLHGTWSMTSVVATQQLQLQQALANSSSPVRSNLDRSDPSVKILTRGSVLERVQQFEKAPVGSNNDLMTDPDQMLEAEQEVDITIKSPEIVIPVPTSKQALYKTRVSSIQNATATSNSLDNIKQQAAADIPQLFAGSRVNKSGSIQHPGTIGNGGVIGTNAVRKLSLRRRSSTTNSNSIIPKFYHPNGRPNTYEIEVQKKNIVACFDKLPDKRALLAVPIYKRHFSAIAIACGFPEYIKEPLYLYIKYQLTQSNLLHNPSSGNGPILRKQSGIALMSNGNSSSANNQQLNAELSKSDKMTVSRRQSVGDTKPTLTRAATIDNSTMEKIQNQTYISCEQFLTCWRHLISTCFDNPARFVHLLTFGKRNHLLPDDFVPLVQSIIEDHPGLKFLRAAPDFHMRYIQTVIARIYFCVNKSWTGKISLSELRQSNLLAVLQVLGQEEDINQITDYFSYEHFYVIYCKFWSLDQDHDLLISKEDLAKHNDAAISSRIIERMFMGIVSKHIQQTGKMSYSDFVWFLIAEEDKKHPRSIEYWFRLMDIDGDGYISMYEMEYFYYEQMKRLELMNIEALPFVDSACQILDLVNPKEKNKISLSDLKRSKMATIFFDTFINLEKYLEHESREFVSTRDCVQDGIVISDWDRYASEEYESLVAEESTV